jgi:hypothetical protein
LIFAFHQNIIAASKLGEFYLTYKGGISFKNTSSYFTLYRIFKLRASEFVNLVTYELAKLYISGLFKKEDNEAINRSNKDHPKKKPPKLSRKPIATAATGRWNILMIPSIKSLCQAFSNFINKNREVHYDSKKTR